MTLPDLPRVALPTAELHCSEVLLLSCVLRMEDCIRVGPNSEDMARTEGETDVGLRASVLFDIFGRERLVDRPLV